VSPETCSRLHGAVLVLAGLSAAELRRFFLRMKNFGQMLANTNVSQDAINGRRKEKWHWGPIPVPVILLVMAILEGASIGIFFFMPSKILRNNIYSFLRESLCGMGMVYVVWRLYQGLVELLEVWGRIDWRRQTCQLDLKTGGKWFGRLLLVGIICFLAVVIFVLVLINGIPTSFVLFLGLGRICALLLLIGSFEKMIAHFLVCAPFMSSGSTGKIFKILKVAFIVTIVLLVAEALTFNNYFLAINLFITSTITILFLLWLAVMLGDLEKAAANLEAAAEESLPEPVLEHRTERPAQV